MTRAASALPIASGLAALALVIPWEQASAQGQPAPPPVAAPAAVAPGPGQELILEGEVVDPIRQAYPLAALPLVGEGEAAALAAEASRVLLKDLDLSGYFKLIPPKTIFFDHSKEGLSATSINFGNWFNTGAQGLVKGQVTLAGGKAKVDVRLFQVDRGVQVDLGLRPRDVEPGKIHLEVHRWVNAIIKHYTGQPGIFGSQVAYVAKTKGGKAVMVLDLDGRHRQRVSRGDSLNLLPSWSPAGGALLYTSYANGNPDLVLHALGSGEPVQLSANEGLNVGGAFAPNGSVVALTLSKDGNSEIYLISASDGRIVQRLTDNWATDTSPTWSPDGSRIAFVSDRSGSPQIYVMNADGSGARRLTFRGNYNTTPDWSPKGDKIAFTARDERYVFDIFVIDVASGAIERLTQDEGHNEEPSFSPDGNYIVFTSTRGGGARLWVMTSDGLHQRPLTEKGSGYHTPAWGPVPSL